MNRDLPTAGELLRRLAKVLFSAIAAVAVVAALLLGACQVLVEPARGGGVATPSGQAAGEGGLRGLALRLYLEANAGALAAPSDDPDAPPVAFEVAPGETAGDVAARLAELNLVRDATAFRMLLQYHGIDRQIEAGRFQLSPAMAAEAVAQALRHASPDETVLVALEGWRLEQVAEAVELAFGDAAGFMRAAGGEGGSLLPEWAGAPVDVRSAEGFLFPDTYRFDPDTSGADVAAAMVTEFGRRFDEAARARAAELGLTPYEVVILASIVEREAVVPEERPLIAAAFLNRVRLGMRLEADPTVQYALGRQGDTGRWWKVPLLGTDVTDTVSPYNTYLSDGLPPGPICSPGLASLQAVLWPAEVDYLYFVAKGDGSHAFSVSFDEHLANVAKYQGG